MATTVITENTSVEVITQQDVVTIETPAPTNVQVNAVVIDGPPYTGSYSITPSTTSQTLNTAHRTLAQNITIGPIPSNYGLITWNGSVLTVS